MQTKATSSCSRAASGIVTCCLAAILALTSPVSYSAQATERFDYEAFLNAIDTTNRKLERVRGAVDQTRFDASAWLDELDYDADTIIEAVAGEIVFQPYRGVLRGVDGTLQARAGNSADQSLLLAYLLKSAGYDARIVRGELAIADQQRLLGKTSAPDHDDSLNYLTATVQQQFETLPPTTPTVSNWQETDLSKRTEQLTDLLWSTLVESGADLEASDSTEDLLAAGEEYYWVQYREGPSQHWQSSHPAFGSTAFTEPVVENYFTDALPDNDLHKLTISAWVEQKLGKTYTIHRVMDDYTRPVANLHGVALRFRNHPSGLTPETATDLAEAIERTIVVTPMLNGATAPGAKAFNTDGQRIDPFALQSPAAGLFSTLANKLEEAGEAVSEEKNLMALTGMWIEFTFTAPGGNITTQRRYLIPRGTLVEDEQDLLWPLITDHTYVVNTGAKPLSYLADRHLQISQAANEYLKLYAHKLLYPAQPVSLPSTEVATDLGPLAQYRLMATHTSAADTSLRLQPNLLGFRRGYRNAETGFFGVDVVANPIGSYDRSDGRFYRNARETLRQGAWDTVVEHVPAQTLRTPVRANAVNILTAAVQQKIPLHVITPDNAAAARSIDLPTPAAQMLNEELQAGFTVIVPQRKPDGEVMTGWWRLRLSTGESLGMTEDGYGAQYVEYLLDMVDMYLSLADGLNSLQECQNQPTMDTQLCCLMETHINNVGGLAFGSVLGNLGGTAGALVFSANDRMTEENLVPQADANCELLPQTTW